MGGGTSGKSSTEANIPGELKPLYTQTGKNIMGVQQASPLTEFLGTNPAKIADMSGTQSKSLSMLNSNLDSARSTPLENSDIVQAGNRYFNSSIAPGITNQATLSGLGRSTANTNALAAAEGQVMLPLLQGEQGRRDRMIQEGFAGGDIERSVEQQKNNADQADFLRRQGLSEQALFGPMGQLPSTFGQTGKTSSSGGGMFKGLIPFLIPIASLFLSLLNAGVN